MFEQQKKVLGINDLNSFTSQKLYDHYVNLRTMYRDHFVGKQDYASCSFYVRRLEDAYYSIIGQRDWNYSRFNPKNINPKNINTKNINTKNTTNNDILEKRAKILEKMYPQMKIKLANFKFDQFNKYMNEVKELKKKGYKIDLF